MSTFVTSGPISISGAAGSDRNILSFITDAGGTVDTSAGISLSGLFGAASVAGITLSGSAIYAAPYMMSEFYGMTAGSLCCLGLEDGVCFGLEDGGILDLECCPVCIGTEEDADSCVLAEDGRTVDLEACSTVCCIELADGTCILLADGVTPLDLAVCP